MSINNFSEPLYIYFDTMGCAKNLVDSEYALARLAAAGFVRTDDPFLARVVVVNTCGFINDAKQESINRLLELAYLKQDGRCLLLVATGCLAQRYRRQLPEEMPEVDLWLGTEEYDELPERLWQALEGKMPPKEYKKLRKNLPAPPFCQPPRCLLTPPYTAYLKIAEGCSNCCSFCAIPNIRGPLHSQPLAELLAEAKRLRATGVQELCLIAQDTTAYGRDLSSRLGSPSLLPELLRELDKLNFPMLRLLYAYPEGIDDELLAAMRDCRSFCHYLDIPLQHISNSVLHRMNRLLDKAQIVELLAKLREYLPDLVVRTTLMVGFPGETEDDFAELLDFAANAELDWAGVFQYSQEEDTPAASMPEQVPEEVKQRRYNELTDVLAAAAAARLERYLGSRQRVLLEQPSLELPGFFEARSMYQAPDVDGLIYVQNEDGKLGEAHIGKLLDVEIIDTSGYDLIARLV